LERGGRRRELEKFERENETTSAASFEEGSAKGSGRRVVGERVVSLTPL